MSLMKRIVVFGSTGSIGQQTMEVLKSLSGQFQVVGISGYQREEVLFRQIEVFRPQFAVTGSQESQKNLKERLRSKKINCKILWGEAGLLTLTRQKIDLALMAIVGIKALVPLYQLLKRGITVALANKEALVVAGELLTKLPGKIIPVDSEHSAIFQCLAGSPNRPKKIILTASGGPFYRRKKLDNVTAAMTLKHPVWQMGKKITVDSATLINKGLEVIEAHYLFRLPVEDISVLIHPQSIVHSLVEFTDNSILAQLAYPDMRLPIQYALTWPRRLPALVPTLNLATIRKLEFFLPDEKKFPGLPLAMNAGRIGRSMPVVFNAANDEAVKKFLEGKIKFTEIVPLIEKTMNAHQVVKINNLDDIYQIDRWARNKVTRYD